MALSVFNLHSDGKKSITINYSLQLNTHYRIEFTVLKTINSISQLTKRTNHSPPLLYFFPLSRRKTILRFPKTTVTIRPFPFCHNKLWRPTLIIRGVLCGAHGSWSWSLSVFPPFFSPRLGCQIASLCFNGMIIIVSYLVHPKLAPAAPSTDWQTHGNRTNFFWPPLNQAVCEIIWLCVFPRDTLWNW